MKNFLFLAFVCFGLIFGCFAQSCDNNSTDSGVSSGLAITTNNVTDEVSKIEQDYLNYKIDLTYVAIRASAECLSSDKNITTQSVLQLCRYLNATERAKLEILQDFQQFYYGDVRVPSLNATDAFNNATQTADFWMSQLDNITSATGAEFEQAFLRWLLVYQSASMSAALTCSDSAFHKEIADTCNSDLASLTTQKAQVRGLLCGKYKICQVVYTPEELAAIKDGLDAVSGSIGENAQGQGTAIATQTNLETKTATDIGTRAHTQTVA
jgi:hypothetical protein